MSPRSRYSRRDLLKGGAAGAVLVAAPAAVAQEHRGRTMNLGADFHTRRRPSPGRDNPILFWNDAALQLVALDHSIDARDARAPGPCATARALGLVHIVMADACAAVYPAPFEGFFVRGTPRTVRHPEAFLGGAAAWILEFIYGTPAHSHLIGSLRLRFLDALEPSALPSWEAGLAFARDEAFTSRWRWLEIRRALVSNPTPYVPRPRGHTVDPFNADQGFYGVEWGRQAPLDPRLGDLAALGAPEPPREGDRAYRADYEEVRRIGAWRGERPTDEQVRIGLFWSYDGARLIGTPPRLYNQIVRQIAEDDEMSIPETARLLALCNLAMADAGIVAWEGKYRYAVWRPVVAIRQGGTAEDWRPHGSPRTNPTQFALGLDTQYRTIAQNYLGAGESALPEASKALPYKLAAFTPNFPAYPSGHSTFGSACFNMLKRVRAERARTGADPDRINSRIDFVSDELNGVSIDNFTNKPRPYVPLSYTSIDRMIHDNNRSRVHLGVHWSFDCERGAESGARIADRIHGNAYPLRYARAREIEPRHARRFLGDE
jgi:hypothetical protein